MRLMPPAAYDLLTQVAVTVPAGMSPESLLSQTPPRLLLTDLTSTTSLTADRLRALIRRLEPVCYRAGWLIRERWLGESGDLSSAREPAFGDRDFAAARVGYTVIRAEHSTNPHAKGQPA